jgi:WhiB family redox-sensing transcriptional regulator
MARLEEIAAEVSVARFTDLSQSHVYHLSRYYPPDYWDEASCASVDMELFFPERSSKDQPHISQVKMICMSCPIRTKCLQFALDENEQFGVWGGMTYRERLQLRKLLNG